MKEATNLRRLSLGGMLNLYQQRFRMLADGALVKPLVIARFIAGNDNPQYRRGMALGAGSRREISSIAVHGSLLTGGSAGPALSHRRLLNAQSVMSHNDRCRTYE